MCRNIKTLHNFAPPATAEEIHASALQYVRKLSGTRKPAQVNQQVFDDAVAEVVAATTKLLASLTTSAQPKSREEEARKARERWNKRAARGGQ